MKTPGLLIFTGDEIARSRRATHRADIPWWSLSVDPMNRARCAHFGQDRCMTPTCPRHQPGEYARFGAQHSEKVVNDD